MPTNEKSECCNAKILSCDCMPKDGACFRRCSKCDVDLPTPDKLAEAKNLLKTFYYNWKRNYGKKDLNYHSEAIDTLIKAASLISYEKGREDQRKEKCEHMEYNTYEKVTDGEILFCHECHQVVEYAESPATIESLNPSPDAK